MQMLAGLADVAKPLLQLLRQAALQQPDDRGGRLFRQAIPIGAAMNDRTKNVGLIYHSNKDLDELSALVAKTGALGAIHKTGEVERFLAEFNHLIELRRAQLLA